ncbi:MAG: OmpW family outer membrane protein [Gammaproteobacteria bacterium]
MKLRIATTLLATLIATSAQAWQAGDILLRAGAAGVFPTGDGTVQPSGGQIEADDAWSLGLTGTWMATNNIGIGLLAAWPFDHDIDGAGGLASAGTVGDTKHVPPTVTVQYHFDTGSNLHPFVGAGINYTNFFDEGTTGALSGASLNLDDSWGLAGEIGVDYELQNNWLVGAQLWYIDIDTDATIANSPIPGVVANGSYNVEIDPWVFMVSVGKKF